MIPPDHQMPDRRSVECAVNGRSTDKTRSGISRFLSFVSLWLELFSSSEVSSGLVPYVTIYNPTMPLVEQIQKDIVTAMKAKDEARLSTLRMVKSALQLNAKSKRWRRSTKRNRRRS